MVSKENEKKGEGHPVTVFDPTTSPTGKDVVDFMLAEMDKMIAEQKKATKKV
jgi:hypothetical protein